MAMLNNQRVFLDIPWGKLAVDEPLRETLWAGVSPREMVNDECFPPVQVSKRSSSGQQQW
jgi:hypothetical protein